MDGYDVLDYTEPWKWGNRREFSNKTQDSPSGATPSRTRGGARTSEGDAAKSWLSTINSLTFNETDMAIHLTSGETALQPRLMAIFMEWVFIWADTFHSGAIQDDHPLYNMAVHCARIVDTLDNFSQT